MHTKNTHLRNRLVYNNKKISISRASTSHDVWQFGIVIFVCLTGCLPWQKATQDDPRYARYLSWHSSTISLKRQPKLFKLVSSKAQKLFKKYLEPRPEKRPAGLAEVHRFLEDRWMSKGGMGIDNSNNLISISSIVKDIIRNYYDRTIVQSTYIVEQEIYGTLSINKFYCLL